MTIEIIAATLFVVALVHTFSVKFFERLASKYPRHAGLFHLLGEVEVVFGFWAVVLVCVMALVSGGSSAVAYAESRQYAEPLFVFVIMVIAASRPVLVTVQNALFLAAKILPVRTVVARVWLGLAAMPLMGSLITEPASMTLAALTLAPMVFRNGIPEKTKYVALGVLFVNISIGGTLTAFAAPPVLMVSSTWNWDSMFMATTFGWKATIAVIINATAVTLLLSKHLKDPSSEGVLEDGVRVPLAISGLHFLFLAGVVTFAHHPVIFLGLFLLFLGFAQAYERYQSELILKEALLVGFFLAGLVVLGGMQQWWLQPIVSRLDPLQLFFGATALTAITDNAALTYLGSLIEGISDSSKYMLVAGALTGGGLTVIANAPNPAGVTLLKKGFEDETIGAGGLLLGALLPTAVAASAFLL
ncbi:MAG: putative Na+/H+ antiporter [Luteimonas sp.]|nr:putative Na+/H+ antiporter [Luteimonas sp.]